MPRITVAGAVGGILHAGIAILVAFTPGTAWPCSLVDVARTDVGEGMGPFPSRPELRFWMPNRTTLRLELTDASRRPIPTVVMTNEVPLDRLYGERQTYIALRPVHPLPPGTYRVSVTPYWSDRTREEDRRSPGIAFEVSSRPMPRLRGPKDLRARLALERCAIGVTPNCGRILGDCSFLILEFESELLGRESFMPPSPVYGIAWTPLTDGHLAVKRRRELPGIIDGHPDGTRTILKIPVEFLRGMRDDDEAVRLEVWAMDLSWHRSPAAATVVAWTPPAGSASSRGPASRTARAPLSPLGPAAPCR